MIEGDLHIDNNSTFMCENISFSEWYTRCATLFVYSELIMLIIRHPSTEIRPFSLSSFPSRFFILPREAFEHVLTGLVRYDALGRRANFRCRICDQHFLSLVSVPCKQSWSGFIPHACPCLTFGRIQDHTSNERQNLVILRSDFCVVFA